MLDETELWRQLKRHWEFARERIYIMEAWDAAEWRAPWRSPTLADPVPPAPSSLSPDAQASPGAQD
ncbi:hypothetical protein [Jiangella gansuensis]|uniref:hypothetical protein n=1 Tax=Jiangella gansuensis TaxID=281473 RepID=UPI0012F90ACB|nr:hypothetical protein [Jiangella gansuensis]